LLTFQLVPIVRTILLDRPLQGSGIGIVAAYHLLAEVSCGLSTTVPFVEHYKIPGIASAFVMVDVAAWLVWIGTSPDLC
jgi:hypothetical protein